MVKRLLIVIGVILGIVFVPYLLHPVSQKIINMPIIADGVFAEWFDGLTFCESAAAFILIIYLLAMLIKNIFYYIKRG